LVPELVPVLVPVPVLGSAPVPNRFLHPRKR